MKRKAYDNNKIRRAIALSIPLVLSVIVHHRKNGYEKIMHLLPTYELQSSPPIDNVFFTPLFLEHTGKRRRYVNADGRTFLFLRRRDLRKLASDQNNLIALDGYERPEDSIIDELTNRWVMSGKVPEECKNLKEFVETIELVEKTESKKNHPPLGESWCNYFFGFSESERAAKSDTYSLVKFGLIPMED